MTLYQIANKINKLNKVQLVTDLLRPTHFIVAGSYGAIFSRVCAMSAKHCTRERPISDTVNVKTPILMTSHCFGRFLNATSQSICYYAYQRI